MSGQPLDREKNSFVHMGSGKRYRFTFPKDRDDPSLPAPVLDVCVQGDVVALTYTSGKGEVQNLTQNFAGDPTPITFGRNNKKNRFVCEGAGVSREQGVIARISADQPFVYSHFGSIPISPPQISDLDAPQLARPTMEPENHPQGAQDQEAGGESLHRLESGHEYTYAYPNSATLKLEVDGTEVTAIYNNPSNHKNYRFASVDLTQGNLTIGRAAGSSLQIDPNETFISGNHAVISLSPSGAITCSHATARNKPQAPDAKKIERKPEMWLDGGDGAGVCEDNPCLDKEGKRGNLREQNEDRGLAMNAPSFSAGGATEFLEYTFNKINSATKNMKGGSTLSAVMATKEGNYACAYVGDSPIYVVGYNPQTRQAKLVQVSFPHNIPGIITHSKIPKEEKGNEISFDKARELYENNKPVPSSLPLYGYLGLMNSKKEGYTLGLETITPQKHLPDGFEFKGMMVCSDGVQLSDENNHLTREATEMALSRVFAQSNDPDPQAIAHVMVGSAMPGPNGSNFKHSNDNITAVFLPAGGKGLIAVADGNTNTAKLAEKAIKMLHEHCIAAMQAQEKSGGIVSNGEPELGAKGPAHKMPPDVRRGTEPPRGEEPEWPPK